VIVLDEQLNSDSVAKDFGAWDGRIVTMPQLGWAGLSDESILRILRQHRGCTFVTINHRDFWNVVDGDARCAIICLSLPTRREDEASDWVHRLFRMAPFSTQRARSGHVIKITAHADGAPRVWYYRRRSERRLGPVPLP